MSDSVAPVEVAPRSLPEPPLVAVNPIEPSPFHSGNPALLGYPAFSLGSMALGFAAIGMVPASAAAGVLPIAIAATGVADFVTAIWAIALGRAMLAALFATFAGFWWSYAALVLGIDHHWYGIAKADVVGVETLYLISWCVILICFTLATLRYPVFFVALFVFIDVALVLSTVGTANGDPTLIKISGWLELVYAAMGLYMFLGEANEDTGGKLFPLGPPFLRAPTTE